MTRCNQHTVYTYRPLYATSVKYTCDIGKVPVLEKVHVKQSTAHLTDICDCIATPCSILHKKTTPRSFIITWCSRFDYMYTTCWYVHRKDVSLYTVLKVRGRIHKPPKCKWWYTSGGFPRKVREGVCIPQTSLLRITSLITYYHHEGYLLRLLCISNFVFFDWYNTFL
jgi:hypothetical protein